MRPLAVWVATTAVVAMAALGVALYPTATLLAGLLALVLALAVVRPALAFALAVGLFCFEGTVKIRLSLEAVPSPLAVGAALLDVMLAAGVVGMLVRRRAAPFLVLWRQTGILERVGLTLLTGWLTLSVAQLATAPSFATGLHGLRLSQGYVAVGVLGGVLWGASAGPSRLPVLCAAAGVAAAYAVLRMVTGPAGSEETYALFATDATSAFGESFRAIGSFSGAFGLASMLAPLLVLSFALALTHRQSRWRWGYGAVCGLMLVAVAGSQVRTGLVAAGLGIALVVLLVAHERGLRTRRAAHVAIAVLALVAVAGTAVVLAGGDSAVLDERARGFVSPLSDESVRLRLETWERVFNQAVDDPLGSGVGTVGRATGRTDAIYTDNSYLKILREQGFLGALLFLGAIALLLAALLVKLVRLGPEHRPDAFASLAAFCAFLVMMVAGEYIEQPGKVLAWTLLGVALWELRERRGHQPEGQAP